MRRLRRRGADRPEVPSPHEGWTTEASSALASTYRRREDGDGARAVAAFFGELENFASAETVAAAAAAAFGPTFVTAEEEAVLCALSDERCDPAAVIEAAAGLIPLRQRGGPVARAQGRPRG